MSPLFTSLFPFSPCYHYRNLFFVLLSAILQSTILLTPTSSFCFVRQLHSPKDLVSISDMSTSTSRAHYNIPSTRLQATIDESEPITHTKNMGEHELGTLIVVGSSNQDLTTYTESIPKLGQTVLGQRFEVSPGGKGANQAIAAAKMLKQSNNNDQSIHTNENVHIITRVGDDAFAKLLMQNFDQSNVQYDQTSIVCPDTHTGVAPILVDQKTGDNMIVVVPGANNHLTPEMVRDEMNNIKDKIKDMTTTVVLSQLEVPLESTFEAMKIGKEWGATTILNPAPCNNQILDDDLLKYVDIIIPNETELQQLVGSELKSGDEISANEEAMAKKLFEKGIQRAVIVTLGARGAMVVTKPKDSNGEFDIKYVNAPSELECNSQPVVDTIGAGDCFCGSLSLYLSAGMDLTVAAMKACGVASMSVRKGGAQTSYPSYEDLPPPLRLDI